jgi:hypothetical protein
VEDHELRRSRRLLVQPPVTLEPPLPLLRRKLDQQGSFEVTGSQEIVLDQHPEESTVLDLGAKAFGLVETSTTDLLTATIVPVHPYECQTVSHAAMETNVVTSSGNSSIPTMVVTIGEFPPPNPLSPVQATMVSTASSSHSGPILSLEADTTPFQPSATGPPFSHGMPSSGTSHVLSYSTSQNSGLGAGSSNAPLQGHMGGTSTPFNTFPYGGGNIPPSSPSLGGTHLPSTGPPAHHSLFGAGSQGPPSHNMSVGSTPFSLFSAFGNNAFSSASFPTGAIPILNNLFLCRVLFLHRGHTQELLLHQGLGILGRDPFPHQECQSGVILFTINGTLDKVLCVSPWD